MNPPAIAVYADHGIDLGREPLEIAVCAQHNNGGLRGNIWWESNIRRLFPVGEVNGTHGVYRPGGSALNSGQVGSLRAAEFIAARRGGKPLSDAEFLEEAEERIAETVELARRMIDPRAKGTARIDRAVGGAPRPHVPGGRPTSGTRRRSATRPRPPGRSCDFLRKNARVGPPRSCPPPSRPSTSP